MLVFDSPCVSPRGTMPSIVFSAMAGPSFCSVYCILGVAYPGTPRMHLRSRSYHFCEKRYGPTWDGATTRASADRSLTPHISSHYARPPTGTRNVPFCSDVRSRAGRAARCPTLRRWGEDAHASALRRSSLDSVVWALGLHSIPRSS